MPMAILFLEVIFTAALATPASTQDDFSQAGLRTAVEKVAKENISAVVHIETMQRKEVVNPFFPFENDFFFDTPLMSIERPGSSSENFAHAIGSRI